jgi:hypothetical protein
MTDLPDGTGGLKERRRKTTFRAFNDPSTLPPMRLPMRFPRAALTALAVLLPLGLHPASALTLTGTGGVNAGNAAQFRDPDEQAAHIANGGGPSSSATWADRTIQSETSSAVAPIPLRPNPWPAPGLIIGDHWQYPPTKP